MEGWKKMSVRRWCSSFQLTRRGLHVYILMCVFASSFTLFVISLQLYGRFYLHGFSNRGENLALTDTTSEQGQDTLRFGSRSNPRNIPQSGHGAISALSGSRGKKYNRHINGAILKPVLSPPLLTWDYHRNTTAPRKMFDCKKLICADPEEQTRYKTWINSRPDLLFSTLAEDAVPHMTSNCTAFKHIRGYRGTPGTPEERDFPLAHVILVHKDFEHLERLVRALYRPQHSFCIHVDSKATDSLKRAVTSFADCFDNIRLAPRPYPITYAHVTRLVADIDCMELLLRQEGSWKYLINYAATELPIRTNLETVQILTSLHGLNDIHETFQHRVPARFQKVHKLVNGRLKATDVDLPPAPHNITIVKGQAYNSFSRAFLEWLFKDQRPRDLLLWSTKTYSPDEHYWASLNDLYHNRHLESPGGFTGDPEKKGYLTKFILWTYRNSRFICHGRAVHNICNFNALDLPTIVAQHHLAANKYDLTIDPVAYACMEELLENRTATPDPRFNKKKYETLYFVRSSLQKKVEASAG